jgi:formylglycine-generating enzyme required for sulfatase activity
MKINRLTLFITVLVWLGNSLFGASQVLNNLSYSQRANSKLVDLSYILNLSQGQTAEISFQFSSDDGLTFPVACKTIRGDVGKGITSGPRFAVWDAGLDWPINFTEKGRIKAICIVSGGTQPPSKPVAIEFVSVPFKPSSIAMSPSWYMAQNYEQSRIPEGSKTPSKFNVSKYEVTNHQWNEVVTWAVQNGYDLVPMSYPVGEENVPRTNVAIKEVIKWLNALSEMNNLTPCYYVDPLEPRYDDNGDGKFSAGPDDWFGGQESSDYDYQNNPNFDWSLIPNGKENLQGGWLNMDPNMNYKWDPGEPWYDRNRNRIFEPQEFMDLNENGRLDDGQTIACRSGDISSIEKVVGWFALVLHEKRQLNSLGYVLPEGIWHPDFHYLAMGGRVERGEYGEYHEPFTGKQKKGIVYIEEWPWGSTSPDEMSNIDQFAITPFGAFSKPQSVGQTKANGYGIYDMVGNVRELTKLWRTGDPLHNPGSPPGTMILSAVGGSVKKGFEKTSKWNPADPSNPGKEMIYPSHVMAGDWYSNISEAGESDVGFRPIRIQY